ncbi:MAG TPA: hypothetical protein DCO79_00115 [Spirochaeta sp.]|nr:hypothetical protein [Spirochaeta sp.]
MAKKTKTQTESQKLRLEKELTGLIPEIMEEGLLFLIKQANTIIHNQRTVKINREMNELNQKKGEEDAEIPKPVTGEFDIEISRSDNGKTYYFIVNGRKHFFDIPETQKVVALCYRPETKSAALKFLYEFFLNERDEILSEHGIKSAKSPFFEALFREVRANFTLDD